MGGGVYDKIDELSTRISSVSESVDKNGKFAFTNPTSDLYVNDVLNVFTQQINIRGGSGKILIIGSLLIKHNGGTPTIEFCVDGSSVASFYASTTSMFYTFSCVKTGLAAGSHTVELRVNKSNSNSPYIPAYTARNLSVIEI